MSGSDLAHMAPPPQDELGSHPGVRPPPPFSMGWAAVLALEAVLATHSSQRFSWFALMAISFALWPSEKPKWQPWATAVAYGAVIGQTITSTLIAVPLEFLVIGLGSRVYPVMPMLMLRVLEIGMAGRLWKRSRPHPEVSSWWKGRTGGLLFGLLLIIPIGLFEAEGWRVVLGHRPSKQVLAAQKAAEQLGPVYEDYRYHVEELATVFREGESVTWRGRLIAYNLEKLDMLRVEVTWTEPWD